MTTMIQRSATIAMTMLLVMASLFATDQVRVHNMVLALSSFSMTELRGFAQQDGNMGRVQSEIDRIGIDEVRRRVENIESQMIGVRLAVIESQLATLFMMGQIIVGAVVVYFVQVAGKAVLWINGRVKQSG